MLANGVEATAKVEGARRTSSSRRNSVESFSLKRSRGDDKGRMRTADSVWVSQTFMKPHVSSFFISLRAAPIEYLTETESAPILLDDVGYRKGVGKRILTMGAVPPRGA